MRKKAFYFQSIYVGEGLVLPTLFRADIVMCVYIKRGSKRHSCFAGREAAAVYRIVNVGA